MWIRELMKVLDFAANNIADWVLVEQQKGIVLWVTVRCWLFVLKDTEVTVKKGFRMTQIFIIV
jgi:hypothetical protein